MFGKRSTLKMVASFQTKIKIWWRGGGGEEQEEEEEETKESPTEGSVRDTPAKNAQKSNLNGKDLKPSTPRSKGQESFKKQEKTTKTPKGPSSVEDIKAKKCKQVQKKHMEHSWALLVN